MLTAGRAARVIDSPRELNRPNRRLKQGHEASRRLHSGAFAMPASRVLRSGRTDFYDASTDLMSAVRPIQILCHKFARFKSYATGSGSFFVM